MTVCGILRESGHLKVDGGVKLFKSICRLIILLPPGGLIVNREKCTIYLKINEVLLNPGQFFDLETETWQPSPWIVKP